MPGIDIKNFEKNQKRKKVSVLEFSLELEANVPQKKTSRRNQNAAISKESFPSKSELQQNQSKLTRDFTHVSKLMTSRNASSSFFIELRNPHAARNFTCTPPSCLQNMTDQAVSLTFWSPQFSSLLTRKQKHFFSRHHIAKFTTVQARSQPEFVSSPNNMLHQLFLLERLRSSSCFFLMHQLWESNLLLASHFSQRASRTTT